MTRIKPHSNTWVINKNMKGVSLIDIMKPIQIAFNKRIAGCKLSKKEKELLDGSPIKTTGKVIHFILNTFQYKENDIIKLDSGNKYLVLNKYTRWERFKLNWLYILPKEKEVGFHRIKKIKV